MTEVTPQEHAYDEWCATIPGEFFVPHIAEAFEAGWNAAFDHTRPASEPTDALAEAREAMELAYGLLWHMKIDNKDINLKLASDARKALLAAIGKEGQLRGIDAAKMTDARFTGAA